MDLRKTPPRAGDEKLGDWTWLPRMIDKARATYHGDPGSYSHPCPRDLRLLAQMGLSVEEFREIIDRCATDDEVLADVEACRADRT